MMIIRLAISVFALALLGLAVSLHAAQSEQDIAAVNAATLTRR
jgi:Skp family chaperone for outer membrane proteins